MADENKVLENEVVAGTETTPSTPEITGDFNYDYSKIDSISGVTIPSETDDCKSLLQLAAMAYNMSNKQIAYSQAAFKKYVSVINDIVEKYNGRISTNEGLLATHEDEITELQQLVGNLDLKDTTSLMEATQQLVKVLFNDDNYQNGITTGSGNGIINDHETRIKTLEGDKVTYTYSAGDSKKTHKVEITHTDTSDNEDDRKTDIYTATAVDARINDAIQKNLLDISTSVGGSGSTTDDKYIKGRVDTSGLTAGTDGNPLNFQTENENFLMSEGAIVSTLNSLINALENNLKKMAENFGKFLATFQLEDAVVYNGELFCTRKIKGNSSDWWKAEAPSNGLLTVDKSTTTIGTKTYALVTYTSTYAKDSLPFGVSAYIPTKLMEDITLTETLVPLGIFFGGNITFGELIAENGPWQSKNVVYYVTDKEESYITNGKREPDIFAKGKKGDQGPQGIGIKSIEGTNFTGSGAINTYTITLMNPANNDADIEFKPTFKVTNGYGFSYIGTLTTEHENRLPTTPGDNYPTSITDDWDQSSSGKSVQINDYVIITDSAGNKIKVFNGTAWQEMIKGAVGPQGAAGTSIVPIYFDVADQANLIPVGNLKSSSDYTTDIENSLKNKYKNDYSLKAEVWSTNDVLVIKDATQAKVVNTTLPENTTAIVVKAVTEPAEPEGPITE